MTAHVDIETLAAYWLEDAPAETCDAVEEHVFECARCAERLEDVERVMSAIAARGRRGLVPRLCTPSLLNRLARDGVNVREFTLRSGEVVPCAVAKQDQVLCVRLVGDFSGTGRLDLLVEAAGMPQQRMTDLPVNRTHGEIHLANWGDDIRALPSMQFVFRVVDVREDGEHTLGEYVLDHHA